MADEVHDGVVATGFRTARKVTCHVCGFVKTIPTNCIGRWKCRCGQVHRIG
jgi:hypothetical protein